MRPLRSLILLFAGFAVSASAADPVLEAITVAGADLRVLLSDGRILHGHDLIGGTLDQVAPDGRLVRLQVRDAFADPRSPAGDVWLFDLRVAQPDGTTEPLCEPDPDGRRLAMPRPDGKGGYSLTCTAGAIGKCIRWGYRPWATSPRGEPLAPLHAACVRLVRADYAGNDHGRTRTGTPIDLWDALGIQQPEVRDALPFEAGWTPDGAVCVAHPRVPENGDLDAIVAEQPRLAGRTGPVACTETAAREAGAILFNRSAAPD